MIQMSKINPILTPTKIRDNQEEMGLDETNSRNVKAT